MAKHDFAGLWTIAEQFPSMPAGCFALHSTKAKTLLTLLTLVVVMSVNTVMVTYGLRLCDH